MNGDIIADDLTYSVSLQGLDELIAKLDAATKDEVFLDSLKLSGLFLAGWSKENRLTGPRPQFLGVVTGRLRSSITAAEPEKSGNDYSERIGTNVEYARLHEFGGIINKVSSKGKAFTQNYPERAFLRPAIEDAGNRQKILDILTERINEALAT